jgi:DNA-binding NarL/FixJ family response regulator
VPAHDAWVPAAPAGLSDRARAAWSRSDWPAVAGELIALARERDDAEVLAPVAFADLDLVESVPVLAAHEDAVAALPPSPVRDGVLAFLGLFAGPGDRSLAPIQAAVTALFRAQPALSAALASTTATVLGDRGLWAEAAWFVEAARVALDELGGTDAPSPVIEALWFRMMAAAVLVEWNTYAGSQLLDELSAALAMPRARNLLRGHHAGALIAVGLVRAARGEFGAGAVGIARGVALLPPGSVVRASAHARLALVKYRQGDWAGARRAARSVADVADADAPWIRSLLAAVATLEPAVTVDRAVARARMDDAVRVLAEQPSIQAETILLHARIALAIGANDWSGMIQVLDDAEEPGYRRVYTDHEWRALRAMALRNSGRIDRYRAHLAVWADADGAAQDPYFQAHRSLLAEVDGDGPAALSAARQARALIGDDDDPLGRTWVRIVVGTIVSLRGDPREGMESYESARAELSELGAEGFVRLCTRIIEDTAAHLARAQGSALATLTSQQRRIAELVAEGYTSAEIGQILYLSKKTIDFHVANIVSRLGLSGRRELKRYLAR